MGLLANLSGKYVKFEVGGTPIEFMVISGSIEDDCDQSNYLGSGREIKSTVSHGRLITYSFTGPLLTDNLPWGPLTPSTAITNVSVKPDRNDSSLLAHRSSNAEVKSMKHELDTSNHQIWSLVFCSDGDYSPPELD